MQGYRTSMEDAHCVHLQLDGHPSLTVIGMFDGHNGSAAAEFMAANCAEQLSLLADPCDPPALAECIEQLDQEFMSDPSVQAHGCTACIAIIKHKEGGQRSITVANVGDSRCLVISSSGSVKLSTVDHKPDTESEAKRIRAAGGSVSFGRVDGDLAMSRSIGDHSYKNVGHLGPLQQKVIPTPDISTLDLAPDDLVLVCCDGLVEKLNNNQVANHIHEQLAQANKAGQKPDPAKIMVSLLDHSLNRGSKDNMSAALVLPIDGSNYTQPDEYVVGPFSEWASDRAFVDAFMSDARKHGYTNDQTMAMVHASNSKREGDRANGVHKTDKIMV